MTKPSTNDARPVPDPRSDDIHPFYRMPEVYDILHAPGTALEVRGLEKIARTCTAVPRRPRTTWLEPACGTARYLRLAHRRGHNVVGIDSSAEMVAYAKKRLGISSPLSTSQSLAAGAARSLQSRGAARRNSPRRKPWVEPPGPLEPRRGAPSSLAPAPTATILRADITDFSRHVPAQSIDFAFNLINSIRHLESDAPMLAHFEQMARVLRPGSVYAVGLGLASYGIEVPTEDIWIGRRGSCEVRQCVQYLPAAGGRSKAARMERCINHLTVTRPSGTEEIDFVYDLRTYNLKEWTRLVSKSALAITRAVDEQGNQITATEPRYAIFLLGPR